MEKNLLSALSNSPLLPGKGRGGESELARDRWQIPAVSEWDR